MTQPRSAASPATAPPPGRYRIDPARTTIRAEKGMVGRTVNLTIDAACLAA